VSVIVNDEESGESTEEGEQVSQV